MKVHIDKEREKQEFKQEDVSLSISMGKFQMTIRNHKDWQKLNDFSSGVYRMMNSCPSSGLALG